MSRSRNAGRNSSSVSIRKAHPRRCATDTNEHENTQTPTLSIEAVHDIGRIVRAIKARIDAAIADNQDSSPACTPDPGSGAAASPMGRENSDRAKKEE
jgi:hypothetical protein